MHIIVISILISIYVMFSCTCEVTIYIYDMLFYDPLFFIQFFMLYIVSY